MKVIFTLDGVNYLSQTKREAEAFIDYWWRETITYQPPRPFKTTWRFRHVERAPSYGQFERVNLDKIGF